MTQHILEADTQSDKSAMRSLGLMIGGLLAFTAVLALGVAIAVG